MGIGTNILGYGDHQVDAAVLEAIKNGNMSTLNCNEEVILAEKLVEMHPWADMVRFARSGGEANAIAIRIARASSGKSKVAICGYHGWHDWYLSLNHTKDNELENHLLPNLSISGVPSELKNTNYSFLYNDFNSFKKLIDKHDIGIVKMEVERSNPPKDNFLERIRETCTKKGIVLIFDECTSGFRETFGGLHVKFDVQPDIAVYGKTLGNGYAVSAVVGRADVMQMAQTTFISSSFFTERIGFVAGLAALEEMDRLKSWQVITSIGKAFKKRLQLLADKHSLMIDITGMDALTTYNFKYKNPLEIKTFVIQEMLKEKFLTSNVFYSSVEHSQKDMDAFFESLDKVFFKLAKVILNNEDITKYLDGAICHSGFQRLN